MSRPLRVFLCHASQDKPAVRELYQRLNAEGWMDVWLDEEKLYPGQDWDFEIEKAVESADVVIVCLSNNSVTKEGYVQRELRFVLQIADYKPDGTIFVVPVRLDDCPLPRRLKIWQYIDFFPKNRLDWAYRRLVGSLQMRVDNLGLNLKEYEKAEREKIDRESAEKAARVHAELEKAKKDAEKKLATRQHHERLIEDRETAKKLVRDRKFALGGVALIMLLFWGISALFNREPAAPTAEQGTATGAITPAVPTRTPTPTRTPSPTITPTSTLGIGSTMISEKDGMAMVFVPAGEFTMGSNSSYYLSEQPEHKVNLDAFWIDQTEVTNAMFAKCVLDGECMPQSSLRSGTRGSYYGDTKFDDYPVIYVNWNQAIAYCVWAGRSLPTEAQWEKAARGTDGRTYPWGDTAPSSILLNYNGGVGDTSAVGGYESGKSPYGAYDMAGNVKEWVNDWYDRNYYQISPLLNPQGPLSGESKVLRGGAWLESDSFVYSTRRDVGDPTYTNYFIGFRCSLSQP
jgi:formylglycine-generating enzyme required for sulfatase activity